MKQKYWLCKRKNVFFSFDSETGRRESLHTGDREEAKRIIRAKNDAATQPAINISIGRVLAQQFIFGMTVSSLPLPHNQHWTMRMTRSAVLPRQTCYIPLQAWFSFIF